MNSKYLYYTGFTMFALACVLPFKKEASSLKRPYVETKQNIIIPRKDEYLKTAEIQLSRNIIDTKPPEINAQHAIVIDINKLEVLYEKKSNEQTPIASLAKIMTGIVSYEYLELKDSATVSKNAVEVGENTMGLIEGEELSVEHLLYGLILNSGNDAAVTLAEKVAGSEEKFVEIMNKKARLLGADNTIFADSSGLNKKSETFYSTAEDVAKMAIYSQKEHKELKKIYNTLELEIPSSRKHGYKYLENQTNLLRTYPGVQGMKTGYTEEAGLCLVTYAENEGKEILVVVLNSTDRKGDAILLLDYAYNSLEIDIEHNLL